MATIVVTNPAAALSPDDLLLIDEVALITRLSVDGLRWLRHKGEGPACFRSGRRLMYRRGAVMDWIAEKERQQIDYQNPAGRSPHPAA